MNTKQWSVLSLALIVFSLSELFPPWLYDCAGLLSPAGYHFLFKPPAVEPICFNSDPLPAATAIVIKNSVRLMVQRIILIALTAGIFLILMRRRTYLAGVLATFSICIGVVALSGFVLMIRLGL